MRILHSLSVSSNIVKSHLSWNGNFQFVANAFEAVFDGARFKSSPYSVQKPQLALMIKIEK